MLAILAVTFPIYLVILLGYVAVRTGYSPADTINALSQFTVRICLPTVDNCEDHVRKGLELTLAAMADREYLV
jgi:hypothetical protein